jgi:hypothetical protein
MAAPTNAANVKKALVIVQRTCPLLGVKRTC